MPSLTDILNRIQTWLQSNYPVAAENITPGLSLEEIQATTQSLPFSLPSEVYELYQWSRGHTLDTQTMYTGIFEPREIMRLFTLDASIEVLPTFEDELEECAANYIGKPLFPIFGTDCSYLCVVGDWEDKNSSPIIFVTEINETVNIYTSLTNMMLTVAECFEAGAVFFNEKGFIDRNEEQYSQIYLKNNSKLLELSLEKLRQELIVIQSDPDFIYEAEDNFIRDVLYLDRERRNLPSRQLDFKVLEPLIIAMRDEDENVRNLARKALEELEYDFEQ